MDEGDPATEWYRLEITSRYFARTGVVRVARCADDRAHATTLVASTVAISECAEVRTGALELSATEWGEFLAVLTAARFWELPELIRVTGKWFDGPTCELTGGRAGRVHRVWRYWPDEQLDGETLVRPVRWLEAVIGRTVDWFGCV